MADLDSFRVNPSVARMPTLQATPVADAAPRQFQQLGQAVQSAGSTAAQIYTDVLQQQNQTRVNEAVVELADRETLYANDPNDGYRVLKGKNALERPNGQSLEDEFGGLLEEDVERIALGLSNEAQRRAFRERTLPRVADFRQRIAVHTMAESERYQRETVAGQVSSGVNRLGLAVDVSEIEDARAQIDAGLSQLFALDGTAEGGTRDDIRRGVYTPAHVARLSRLSEAGELEEMADYLNTYRDELTNDARVRVEATLLEQQDIASGRADGLAGLGSVRSANQAARGETVAMPVLGNFRVSGNFNERRGPNRVHEGIDIATPVGTPVRAGAAARVAHVGHDPDGYGHYVDLELVDGTKTRVAHLSRVDVEQGQELPAGAAYGLSGGARGAAGAGNSQGPHVHYEVLDASGNPIDPVEYHRSRSTAAQPGAQRQTQQDFVREIRERQARGEITERRANAAIATFNEGFSLERQAEAEAQEDTINSAYAEVYRTGRVSDALAARLASSGLANALPSLSSFAQSEQRRRSGGTGGLTQEESLPGYAIASEMIASGEITTIEQLFQLNNQLSDTDMRSLVNDLTNPSQRSSTAELVNRAQTLFDSDLDARGLFADEDGRENNETRREYGNFRGALYRQVRREAEENGGRVSDERLREITFGLLAEREVRGGDRLRGYQIRPAYDAIPRADRLRIMRELQGQGVRNPSVRNVIEYYRQTN